MLVSSVHSQTSRSRSNTYFFLVLLKLFDCVDDTVLVSKQILNEVKKNLMEIIQDKYGRLVLLQLLVPGNKRCV